MQNLLNDLKNLLQKDERLVSEGELLKNKIIELALKLDKDLIKLLLSDEKMKEVFFVEVDGTLIFDKDKFIKFVSNKQFLPDSYTAFKNKIGLIDESGEFISEKKEVVISWPYKDCVLEGGMTKEDQKRDEIFWNEILAPDEISRLLDPKVFTNAKRIDAKGEHKFDSFRTDENGNIKDNLIIKGNNLLALHSLKKRFAGKVKLIYIDPPYNTGNDSFKYNDSFNHSTWLTFMKNRLEVARDLLRDDGLVFISIDDNEIHYLKILIDEVFGRENYLNTFCWVNNLKGRQISGKGAVKTYEFILCYAKGKENINIGPFEILIEKAKQLMPSSYKGFEYEVKTDQDGSFILKNELYNTNSAFNEETRPNLVFNIHYNFETKEVKFSNVDENINFDGFVKIPPKRNNDGVHKFHAWRWNKEKILKELSNLEFVKTKDGVKIFTKIRAYDTTNLKDIITDITTTKGTRDFTGLFDDRKHFNYPKPVELIKIFVAQTGNNDIILDFFAGSGTTAHAVLELNKEDGGNRKFILVEQLDEHIEVCKERIQKVLQKEKIADDFVYLELLKWNENFIEKIQKAKTKQELKKLWETMKEKAFLSYKVDVKTIDAHAKEFEDLSIEDQKRFLIECLDKNHLYVNYSEIDDEEYEVSEEDKKLNREFYKNQK
jgi:adenine-specific DNA-methyltransferase